MPRAVFGPRKLLTTVPPPDGFTPQQSAGVQIFAQPHEALQALLLGGAVVVGAVGGPPPPPSQQAGTVVVACEPQRARPFDGSASIQVGPTPQPPSQRAGVMITACEPEPPRPFPGAVAIRTGPAQPLTPQQRPGVATRAGAEPPPPEFRNGRVIQAPWGLAQPVQCPTPTRVAQSEEPRPEPGRLTRSNAGRLPQDNRPTSRVAIARGDDPFPSEGRVVTSPVGFGIARRPVRAILAAPEEPLPARGQAIVGAPPPPNFTAQQLAGVVRVAQSEEPRPEAGRVLTRAYGRSPSDRHFLRPLLARAEEPHPECGQVIARRVVLGHPPPVRPFSVLARAEEPLPEPGRVTLTRTWLELPPPVRARICAAEEAPPYPGWWFAGPALAPSLTPQQLAGRVLLAASEEPPPYPGAVWVLTGRAAGATAPALAGARPGGVFQRADAGNRSFRRIPRMSATMTYQTRVKAPDETIAVVFDFTNFPEVVGGATISSAVVSGAGGAALAGLVAGTPAVLAAAATIDSLGNTVAAGKGVQVALSGGSAGDDVIVECAATLSTGSIAVIQGKVAVRNAS